MFSHLKKVSYSCFLPFEQSVLTPYSAAFVLFLCWVLSEPLASQLHLHQGSLLLHSSSSEVICSLMLPSLYPGLEKTEGSS